VNVTNASSSCLVNFAAVACRPVEIDEVAFVVDGERAVFGRGERVAVEVSGVAVGVNVVAAVCCWAIRRRARTAMKNMP